VLDPSAEARAYNAELGKELAEMWSFDELLLSKSPIGLRGDLFAVDRALLTGQRLFPSCLGL
jgi:hypothetical protein